MNVKYSGKTPKISIFPEAMQQCYDYAKFCTAQCCFGANLWWSDDEEIIISKAFLFLQSSNYQKINLDFNAINKLALVKDEKDIMFSFIGIATSLNRSVELDKDEIKWINELPTPFTKQIVYMKLNKNGEVNVGIFDRKREIIIENAPFGIDCSYYGKSDSEVKQELASCVSFITPNYNASATTTSYVAPKAIYKDADINIKNPDIASIVATTDCNGVPFLNMKNRPFNYDGFKLLCRAKQENLIKYLGPQIEQLYGKDKVTITDKYIYAVGEAPILINAHLDTVHYSLPDRILYDEESDEITSTQGIGGDDRCGLYICLYAILHAKKKPHLLFTMDEETGCVGGRQAAKDLKDKVGGINFLVGFDRHGYKEVVFYETKNREFIDYIVGFGFDEKIGLGSDVKYLTEAWGIASANLSVGYKDEHQLKESINVDHLIYTMKKSVEIIDDAEKTVLFPAEIKKGVENTTNTTKVVSMINALAKYQNGSNLEHDDEVGGWNFS